MEVSHHNTIVPSKMFNVTLFLRRGTYLTCPLPVTEIRMLQIKSCDFGTKESIGNPESSRWPEKIRVLTQNIKKISNLQLSLPGLWTCGYSPAPRLEAYYSFPDPIPKSLPPLQVLALDIPFCSPTPGNYREAQWVSDLVDWPGSLSSSSKNADAFAFPVGLPRLAPDHSRSVQTITSHYDLDHGVHPYEQPRCERHQHRYGGRPSSDHSFRLGGVDPTSHARLYDGEHHATQGIGVFPTCLQF